MRLEPAIDIAASPPTNSFLTRYGAWLGLVAVLAVYVTAVARLHPTNFFGYTSDDMIYFSSAKAIAEGKGYVLPSLPGTPLATKHPILLPWLLSWVWRWNPSFPENLGYAIAMIVIFGCGYVIAAFLFLRRFAGLNVAEALLLTAFCALHPTVLFYSSTIASDIPFATLALAAMLIADRSIISRNNFLEAALAAVIAGFSMLVRTVGVPIAGGIALAYIFRRAWRPLCVFAVCVAPFLAVMMWRSIFLIPAIPTEMAAANLPGWHQTWLYYTDYVGFRKLVFMNKHALWPMALSQFLYLCSGVPGYFTSPLTLANGGLALVSTLVGLWIIVGGLARNVGRSGWMPEHLALILYIALFLTWDYPDWQRFLFPFLPVLTGCFWLEGKRISRKFWFSLNEGQGLGENLIAAGGLAAMLALLLVVCWNSADGDREWFRNRSRERASLLPEKREAYEWLEHNSTTNARVIATEHAVLYLYSGRQSVEPITFLPTGAYDPKQTDQDLRHVTDVAKAVEAEYWFASADDGAIFAIRNKAVIVARLEQVESVLPELFRSSGGHVRIYRLDCVRHPEGTECKAADQILFPSEQDSAAHTYEGSRAEAQR
jgi:hypothetical protein